MKSIYLLALLSITSFAQTPKSLSTYEFEQDKSIEQLEKDVKECVNKINPVGLLSDAIIRLAPNEILWKYIYKNDKKFIINQINSRWLSSFLYGKIGAPDVTSLQLDLTQSLFYSFSFDNSTTRLVDFSLRAWGDGTSIIISSGIDSSCWTFGANSGGFSKCTSLALNHKFEVHVGKVTKGNEERYDSLGNKISNQDSSKFGKYKRLDIIEEIPSAFSGKNSETDKDVSIPLKMPSLKNCVLKKMNLK
jgi:hypothetical protein